jgi:hypothetical protein
VLAADSLALTEALAAVGIAVSSAEAIACRAMLRSKGLLSWELLRLRSKWFAVSPGANALSTLFRYPNVLVLYFLRLVFALLVFFNNTNVLHVGPTVVTTAILILAAAHALLAIRCAVGGDGAQQLLGLILTASGLCRVVGGGTLAVRAAVLFIALQVSLSYATAGWAKATSTLWWNGHYLGRILSTRAYGTRRIGQYLLSKPLVSRQLSRLVIVLEIVFPLALVLPQPLCYLLIGAMLGFHVTSALVMGLGNFVWAFGATYPAVLYANEIFQHFVRG